MLEIRIEKTSFIAAKKAALALEEIFARYQRHSVLVLLSGGSPLEILQYMPPIDDRVTVSVSDDRFSTDPTINNFSQIQHLSAQHWIDTRPKSGESVEEAGVRFDAALKKWKHDNPTGKIVMTQGIGLDGHTAGIIGRVFDDLNIWAIGYEAQNKYPLRITVTFPFLRMVDDSVLYVCGEEKRLPLEATVAKTGELSSTPARIIHEMKHCLLFTDIQI